MLSKTHIPDENLRGANAPMSCLELRVFVQRALIASCVLTNAVNLILYICLPARWDVAIATNLKKKKEKKEK